MNIKLAFDERNLEDKNKVSYLRWLSIIFSLQKEQDIHDENYHRDIYFLNKHDRMRHYALHISKYVGFISLFSIDEYNSRQKKSIVDMTIICIAALNALQLDFGNHEEVILYSYSDEKIESIFFRAMSKLCKACETREHLDTYDYQGEYTYSILLLLTGLYKMTTRLNINIEGKVRDRWTEIERNFHLTID